MHDIQAWEKLKHCLYMEAGPARVSFLTVHINTQEKAAQERDMLVKLRKQKRKSADLETGSAARAVFNLTASANASQPDAPRCAWQPQSITNTYSYIHSSHTLHIIHGLGASPIQECSAL